MWNLSDSDSKLKLFTDGSTIQKAADLLLGDHFTIDDRKLCGRTYLRSLADFAFCLIAGDRLLVNADLPDYREGVHPGRDLLSRYAGRVEYVAPMTTFAPESLLTEEEGQRTISGFISLLPRDDDNFQLWQEHMIREVRMWLGEDPTLMSKQSDPTTYVFRKPFWTHIPLQNQIKQEWSPFLERIASKVTALGIVPLHVQNEALIQFISRDILAHIAIFESYQRMSETLTKKNSILWLPHCTRATLIANPQLRSSTKVDYKIWDIFMPHILTPILKKAKQTSLTPRKVALNSIEELAFGHTYDWLRKPLAEIVPLLNAQRTANDNGKIIQEIDKLIALINKHSFNLDAPIKSSKLAIKGKIGMTAGMAGPEPSGSLEIDYERTKKPKVSREIALLARASGVSAKEYIEAACAVFPELGFGNSSYS